MALVPVDRERGSERSRLDKIQALGQRQVELVARNVSFVTTPEVAISSEAGILPAPASRFPKAGTSHKVHAKSRGMLTVIVYVIENQKSDQRQVFRNLPYSRLQ